jgi:uncharacterized cupredoxin-like copper-binding protein
VKRAAALLLGVVVVAGCGSSYGGGGSKKSSGGSGGKVRKTITVSEKEFSLSPNSISVAKTGTYAFKAMNNGTTTHALEVEGNGVEAKTGNISPGSSATLKVKFSKNGSYEIYCPVDSHKQQGMKGDVTVGAASGGGGGTTTGMTQTSTGKGYGGY